MSGEFLACEITQGASRIWAKLLNSATENGNTLVICLSEFDNYFHYLQNMEKCSKLKSCM
jgi:hypothetical protein